MLGLEYRRWVPGANTAGGLPLQFPDESDNAGKMISYYQHWKPDFAPGTQRRKPPAV